MAPFSHPQPTFGGFPHAARDDFREMAFAFLAQEIAVVGGHRLEVLVIFRTERLEVGEGAFEMAARPRAVAGAEQGEREIVVGLRGVRMFLAEQLAAGFECDLVHLAGLLVETGSLIERAEIAGNGGGLLVILCRAWEWRISSARRKWVSAMSRSPAAL